MNVAFSSVEETGTDSFIEQTSTDTRGVFIPPDVKVKSTCRTGVYYTFRTVLGPAHVEDEEPGSDKWMCTIRLCSLAHYRG